MMPEEESQEYVSEDASRYLAEMKIDALGKLFPIPEELARRIALITHLTGARPNIQKLYLARVQWVALLALRNRKPIPWSSLDPVEFLTTYAPSIGGERAKQAVEIASATRKEAPRRGLARFFLGPR